jgi:hypothetical protein
MADSINVSLAVLGLVQNLDKIFRLYRLDGTHVIQELNDVFGELSILQNVLVESKLMVDELSSKQPSMFIALQRCQELEKQLTHVLYRAGMTDEPMKKIRQRTRMLFLEPELRRNANAFKDSVLLFRGIVSE